MTIEGTFLPFHRAEIGDEEIEAVVAVLRSGWLTSGPKVKEFEAAFAAYIGVEHAVAVNSATAALHLGLEALGIRHGDEVIVPTMTFAASAEVVRYLGGTPILVDCDPDTLTIRAADIERALTARTKAIMPVHYGGYVCDMDPILELAAAHGIKTIEDAAHSLPASYKDRRVGTIGDLTAFSFYATKTLTTGEGGMLTTSNAAYADRARIMSLHGISRHAWNRYGAEGSWRYDILDAGFKYNLTDVAAALGVVQLRRVEEMRDRRRRVTAAYDEAFSDLPEIRVPARSKTVDHAWHLYPIRLQLSMLRVGRDAFIEDLKGCGIGTSVHFIPLHLHPYYRASFGYKPGDFPHALAAFEALISLPVFPAMSPGETGRVTTAVTELIHKYRR